MSIHHLSANNDVENVPHMLRNLASQIERGEIPDVKTLLVTAVHDPDMPPIVFSFGEDSSAMEVVGAFAAASTMILTNRRED